MTQALSSLIVKATAHERLFVFGELLALQGVQDLKARDDCKAHFALLELFAYGTYGDYNAAAGLPPLSEAQARKLKQLTLVSFAQKAKSLAYADLLRDLEIANVRDLEDLVIDSVYAQLLDAKLDQRRQVVEVHYACGRDMRVESLPELTQTLQAWADKSAEVLGAIAARATAASEAGKAQEESQRQIDEKVAAIKATLKAAASAVDSPGPARAASGGGGGGGGR